MGLVAYNSVLELKLLEKQNRTHNETMFIYLFTVQNLSFRWSLGGYSSVTFSAAV